MIESIRQNGLLQPIVVRTTGANYQIIAGERRWQAARSLGMTNVPVVIRDVGDEEMLELALVENIQREDLNAIDRAKGYQQLCQRCALKPETVAAKLGEDRTTVVNYLRLLDLSEPIQEWVAQGRLSMGHARCLLGVTDENTRERMAQSAANQGLSVRVLEGIVRSTKAKPASLQPAKPTEHSLRNTNIRDMEHRFEVVVKSKVTIKEGRRKGTGRIIIDYYSLDDFDRIAALLGVEAEA